MQSNLFGNFVSLGLLAGAFSVTAPVFASASCLCNCRLGDAYGFHQVCNKTYKSPDNGGYYCYDSGWDYTVTVNGTSDACLDVETQNVACSGWLVKTDDIFDNDPLNPIPATPVWLSGVLDTCTTND